MRSTSFNKTSIQRLENYSGLTKDLLSKKMSTANPPSNEEIRSLITRTESKYNSRWRRDRENSRRDNEGRFAVGQESPLPYMMQEFKNNQEKIPDHALPSALDKIVETLSKRRTANFSAFDESAFKMGMRKLPNATTGLISNGANYLVKYPIMAGLGGIAIGAIFAESGIRAGLTCLSCLGYGALTIAKRLESTSFLRKVCGNNEFKIQRAQQSVGSAITNLVENHYTLGAINRSFSSNGIQESSQKKDRKQLQEAENARFDEYKKEEERQEAKKRRKKEEKQKEVQKPQSPKRASSLPSPRKSTPDLFDKNRKLKVSTLRQSSPLTRYSPASPLTRKPPLRGPSNLRPNPNPRQPLKATKTHQEIKGPRR